MEKKKGQINSASAFGSFNIDAEQPNSVQTGMEAAGIKSKRVTKGAAAGCKPGCTRKTFVLPYALIDKISAIAAHTRQKEIAVVIDMLNKGVANYEYQYGVDISSLPKVTINN